MSESRLIEPVSPAHTHDAHYRSESRQVTDNSSMMLLHSLNACKTTGPDAIVAWLLEENSGIPVAPVADILNRSFQERVLPSFFFLRTEANPRLLFGVGATPRWSAPGKQIGILVAVMIPVANKSPIKAAVDKPPASSAGQRFTLN